MTRIFFSNHTKSLSLFFGVTAFCLLSVCVQATIFTSGQVTNEDGTIQWDWNTYIPHGGSKILVGYETSGTLDVSGNSTAFDFFQLFIAAGENTTGSFTMKDGATLIHPFYQNHYIYVASGINSEATMTIKGNGTLMRLSDHIYVGQKDGSHGEFIVEDGAVFEFSEQYAGYNAGSYGKITVDGPGSQMLTWVNNKYTTIGHSGTGELLIRNGGYARTDGTTLIAHANGSHGTVTVTGAGSLWLITNYLTVGRGDGTPPAPAEGILRLARGGKVTANNVAVGTGIHGHGTLDFVIGNTTAGAVNCGLLETPSITLTNAELEIHVDPGVNLTVGTQYTLADYVTLGQGDWYLQFNGIDEGDIYTSPEGYHFRINYATNLGGGDLGITATVTELPPCVVDDVDVYLLTAHWLDTGCSDPNWCDGADLDFSTSVNLGDFYQIALSWLSSCPMDWPWQ